MKQIGKTMKKWFAGVLAAAMVLTLVNPAIPAAAAEQAVDVEWYNLKNNQENNGITDRKTPISPDETTLKWAQKYGTGWSAAPTPPIIVDGKLYVGVNKNILELDKETGEVLRQSDAMVAACGYAMNPLVYADGKIFAQVGNGMIQAVDIKTMKTVWHTEKIGGQTVSPISYVNIDGTGYIYTGTWTGESKEGYYFCVTTDNEHVVDGIKQATWTFRPSENRGFYWAGAYVNENYLAVGSDDGTKEGDYSANAAFYTLDPVSGEVIDSIEGIKGDIRSTTVYDNGYLYFNTKGGLLYKVPVDEEGHLGEASYIDLGGMTTAAPVVYGNKIYVGVCGASQFDPDSGHGFAVVDNTKAALGENSLLYKIPIKGYPQASALATKAYAGVDYDNDGKADGRIYIYFTYNANPGGIYYVYDEPDQTEPMTQGQELFVPSADKQQYCISTLCADREGVLYYKNDSCYLMAVETNPAYVKSLDAVTDNNSEVVWDAEFTPAVDEYHLVVDSDVRTVTLDAVPADRANSLYYDRKCVTLTGEDTVTTSVIVQKEGYEREYVLHIRRKSANADLKEMISSTSNTYGSSKLALTPAFDRNTASYVVDVSAQSKTFYNLWVIAENENAVVEVLAGDNNSKFGAGEVIPVTGTNSGHSRYAIYPKDTALPETVTIKVTSENGKAEQMYSVRFTKDVNELAYAEVEDKVYTGSAIKSAVTVYSAAGEVVAASEYTATYENNTQPGTATVTITAKEGSTYTGTITATYQILRKLSYSTVSPQAYTGEEIVPEITVKDHERNVVPKDAYTISYEDNQEVGTASFTVTAKDGSGYGGSLTGTFSIQKARIAKIVAEKQTYTGKAITPPLKVYDDFGKEIPSGAYEVTFGDNVKVGQAKVTVTAKENSVYRGELYTYFAIVKPEVPKAIAKLTATLTGYRDVSLTWSRAQGANGYAVYYKKASEKDTAYKLLGKTTKASYQKVGMQAGVSFTFKVVPYNQAGDMTVTGAGKTANVTTLKKVTLKTVKKASSKKVTLKWNDMAGETGYEISQSTVKSKTKVVATAVGQSKKIVAKKGKTYYYRVRAYKTVGGKKIYAPWSEAKKYTIK